MCSVQHVVLNTIYSTRVALKDQEIPRISMQSLKVLLIERLRMLLNGQTLWLMHIKIGLCFFGMVGDIPRNSILTGSVSQIQGEHFRSELEELVTKSKVSTLICDIR